MACAAGCVVLDEIENGVMVNAATIGKHIKNNLKVLKEKFPEKIKDVRGLGLMLGIEIQNIDPIAVVSRLRDKKVLVNLASGNVVRLLPPLILSEEEANTFLNTFEEVIESI